MQKAKKDENAPKRVPVSLEISERFLNSARKNLTIDEYKMGHLASYNRYSTVHGHFFSPESKKTKS